MAQVRKFFFETSFDDPDETADFVPAAAARPAPASAAPARSAPVPPAPAAKPEPPPPPAISEADLAAARAEGFAAGQAEGFAAGQAAGAAAERQAAEQRQAAALDAVAARLADVEEGLAAVAEAAQRRAVSTGLSVLRALVPELLRRHGLAEIEALLRESMSELMDEPRLVLRVADTTLDPLQARLPAMTARSGFSGRIILLAEDGMQDGDCRIEWADGGIERNAARLMRHIEATVARLLPGDPETSQFPRA